jgi:hypothetical protein
MGNFGCSDFRNSLRTNKNGADDCAVLLDFVSSLHTSIVKFTQDQCLKLSHWRGVSRTHRGKKSLAFDFGSRHNLFGIFNFDPHRRACFFQIALHAVHHAFFRREGDIALD